MSNANLDAAKRHLVKAIGASSYDEVVRANEEQRKAFRVEVRKREHVHVKPSTVSHVSGSPYLMLSRKINNKGKRV